jgi:hypothetical protein
MFQIANQYSQVDPVVALKAEQGFTVFQHGYVCNNGVELNIYYSVHGPWDRIGKWKT